MTSSKSFFEEAEKIYRLLEDDESKVIFKNRLLYLATGERRYIHKMIECRYSEHYRQFENVCRQAKEIVLYGAGDYCYSAIEALKEYTNREPSCICDGSKDKWGTTGPGGYQVISPDQLFAEHMDATVIISTIRCMGEIRNRLLEHFDGESIFELGLGLSEKTIEDQYFDEDIVNFEANGEYFVDGGAYDLMTSVILSKKTLVKKVYAFEADAMNEKKIRDTMRDNSDLPVELFMKGLWDHEDVLYFDSGDEMESKIASDDSKGNSSIEAVALDDVIDGKVTFIKMDIEGAELNALIGAKETIRKYRPKLAICLYHKPEDMIDIPAYIHELVPEYRFYVRHYADFQYDTVLYAML